MKERIAKGTATLVFLVFMGFVFLQMPSVKVYMKGENSVPAIIQRAKDKGEPFLKGSYPMLQWENTRVIMITSQRDWALLTNAYAGNIKWQTMEFRISK